MSWTSKNTFSTIITRKEQGGTTMSRVLIVYYTRSGNTGAIAGMLERALVETGLEVKCQKVQDTSVDDLIAADGIIIGSPVYYGTMAAEIKKFIDDSVKYHGKLDGKVGAAFASAASSGQETTVFSILEALLIHGMIIQGDPGGHLYGVTAIGKPDEKLMKGCRRFAGRFAELVTKTTGK